MNEQRTKEQAEPDVAETTFVPDDAFAIGVDAPAWTSDDQGIFGAPVNRARQAYAAKATKRKDHIYAGLFAIFLGLFGMHKFYLGYNNSAFIMLSVTIIGSIVTYGIAAAVVWVIAIVEGIIYLTKSQADFDRIYVEGMREWF